MSEGSDDERARIQYVPIILYIHFYIIQLFTTVYNVQPVSSSDFESMYPPAILALLQLY